MGSKTSNVLRNQLISGAIDSEDYTSIVLPTAVKLEPSKRSILTLEQLNQGLTIFNEIVKKEPTAAFMNSLLAKYDSLLALQFNGNNFLFNLKSEKPAAALHNPDFIKTVDVKLVHELIVPIKDGKFYMPEWEPNFKKGAKWCLVCEAKKKIVFQFFQSIQLEKKLRHHSWYHVCEAFLTHYEEFYFSISSLTELLPHQQSVANV